MALNVTDLRNGTFFKEGDNIFQVLSYDHVKMGRGSGHVKVKVKNLKTGAIVEKSFITGARVDEADVEKKKVQFSFEQFPLGSQALDEQAKYLKDGIEVTLIFSGGEVLGIELPNSLVYEIMETGPGEKGNTVSNVFKEATLDNGLVIKVPMFMKVGEKVKVDTRSGEYVERVK